MSKFPKGSVRAAVAEQGDDWMFANGFPTLARLKEHHADMDVVSLCASPYWKGGDNDPRVWSGVELADKVPA